MSEISVRFRIVGIYFGATYKNAVTQEIKVSVPANPTVAQVMEAAALEAVRGQIPGVTSFLFSPAAPTPDEFCESVSVDYNKSPNGRLDSGLYRLQQSEEAFQEQILQYYIFDENFVQKNTKNEQAPFGGPPPVEIEDGDLVLWRMVTIATKPINSSRAKGRQNRMSKAMAANL
ncbi:MAG: hypothetical protein AAGM22_24855 [Acidobacteriota bacterium]